MYLSVDQWLVIVKPVVDGLVLLGVQLDLDGFQGLDVQDVVGVVQGRLLVVKRRETHPLKVVPVSLLPSHHDPHGAPLGQIHGLDDPRDLVDEADGSGDVIQHADVTNLHGGTRTKNHENGGRTINNLYFCTETLGATLID